MMSSSEYTELAFPIGNLEQICNVLSRHQRVSYFEIRKRTGLAGKPLDDGLMTLEKMRAIDCQNFRGTMYYWRLKPEPERHWYTLDEAADYLRVSRRTIYQLLEQKQLVAYRIGGEAGHRRFKREDLDAVMYIETDREDDVLSLQDDPVLAKLWDNEKDAEYDHL